LRDSIAVLRGARNLAYLCDMSRLLRAVRLALKPLTTIWIVRIGTPTCANGKFAPDDLCCYSEAAGILTSLRHLWNLWSSPTWPRTRLCGMGCKKGDDANGHSLR